MLTIKLADNNKLYRASFHLPLNFNDIVSWSKEKMTSTDDIELFDKDKNRVRSADDIAAIDGGRDLAGQTVKLYARVAKDGNNFLSDESFVTTPTTLYTSMTTSSTTESDGDGLLKSLVIPPSNAPLLAGDVEARREGASQARRIADLEGLLVRTQMDLTTALKEKEEALLELAEANKNVCPCSRPSVGVSSEGEVRGGEGERLYIDKLHILENIGFHDVSRNLVVLSRCGGSMQRAIDELIRSDAKSTFRS